MINSTEITKLIEELTFCIAQCDAVIKEPNKAELETVEIKELLVSCKDTLTFLNDDFLTIIEDVPTEIEDVV